jgi:CheY-like chemotaxis protein
MQLTTNQVILISALICAGVIAVSAEGPETFGSRKSWVTALSELEKKHLLAPQENTETQDLKFLGAAIVQPELPYDLRVKSAVLLARICRQDSENLRICENVLSTLKSGSSARNTILASYIQNIAFTKQPEKELVRDVAGETPNPGLPDYGTVSAEKIPIQQKLFNWNLVLGALFGSMLMLGIHLLMRRSPRRLQTALLVDDDPMTLIIMKKLLASLGIQAETFLDPIKALERYSTHNFDLVVLDYSMPKMNGDELARSMSQVQGPQPNLFFYTGKADRVQQAIKDLQPEISQVISKSEDMRSVKQIFERVINRVVA